MSTILRQGASWFGRRIRACVSYGPRVWSHVRSVPGARVWKVVDIREWKGAFLSIGDLDNDGRVEFLLYYASDGGAVQRIIALTHEGRLMWQRGDLSATCHTISRALRGSEPPCRPACISFDIDCDGRSEVIAEMREPDGAFVMVVLDGATGETKTRCLSPFGPGVREPAGYQSSRPTPWLGVAYCNGRSAPPCLIAKYEASARVPPVAVAMDQRLNIVWALRPKTTAIGHIPTICDIDGDGSDEIVFGELAVNGAGAPLFEHDFGQHSDMTDVGAVRSTDPVRIYVSICNEGPAFCLDARGRVLWSKSREDVPHGQGIWFGNFLPDREGREVVILRSGHVGDFITCCAQSGETLARFQHHKGLRDKAGRRRYPDVPIKVKWISEDVHSMWIPADRVLVDGEGNIVQGLLGYEKMIFKTLHPGTSKEQLPVQAIAAPLVGDSREDLVLYQPYNGEAIVVITQSDHDMYEIPYRHVAGTYNRRSYF